MTKRITVVPAKARSVPDPEAGDLLPAEGREVTDNSYWRRRLKDEDVTVSDIEAASAKSKAPVKTEEVQ
jgi:hypothetical protein